MTFKPGDRVECVDGIGNVLHFGAHYEAEDYSPTMFEGAGGLVVDGNWFRASRFRLVDPEPAQDAPQPGLIYTVKHLHPPMGALVGWRRPEDDEDDWRAQRVTHTEWAGDIEWFLIDVPTEHAPAPPDLVPVLLPRDVVEWWTGQQYGPPSPTVERYDATRDACRAALDAAAKP